MSDQESITCHSRTQNVSGSSTDSCNPDSASEVLLEKRRHPAIGMRQSGKNEHVVFGSAHPSTLPESAARTARSVCR